MPALVRFAAARGKPSERMKPRGNLRKLCDDLPRYVMALQMDEFMCQNDPQAIE